MRPMVLVSTDVVWIEVTYVCRECSRDIFLRQHGQKDFLGAFDNAGSHFDEIGV